MIVDVFSSMPHYRDHLRPIAAALAEQGVEVGPWYSTFGDADTVEMPNAWPDMLRPIMVASAADALKVAGRPIIHVEHGAGQTYPGDPASSGNMSYAGGNDMPASVALFLTPHDRGARAWREKYTGVAALAVGCPKLDPISRRGAHLADRPVVAFTFHWDCQMIPETRSAVADWDPYLHDIVAGLRGRGFVVVGTEHPRWVGKLAARWAELKVPFVDAREVLEHADVVVADNTSLLYEAALLDVPSVVLNSSHYRKDVAHGLRFWDAVPGIQIDDPARTIDAVAAAWEDSGALRQARAHAAREAYSYPADGQAAHRAASIIRSIWDHA